RGRGDAAPQALRPRLRRRHRLPPRRALRLARHAPLPPPRRARSRRHHRAAHRPRLDPPRAPAPADRHLRAGRATAVRLRRRHAPARARRRLCRVREAGTLVPMNVPQGWHTVTPRIVAEGAKDLVAFIKRVFDARGDYLAERPSEIWIGDSVVMI